MKTPPPALRGILRAALTYLCSATLLHAAVTFTDITLWAGAPAGEGIRQAALVVDFHDGSPALLRGYRWSPGEEKTGRDMLAAILGADPALTTDSLVFPSTFTSGTRTRTFSDNGTPDNYFDDLYWGYWVNNNVTYHPTDFTQNGHLFPPLGNPYAEGHWVESSTGLAARPLVDGSWDGWSYGPYLTQPGLPIPEPATGGLLATSLLLLARRKRTLPRQRRSHRQNSSTTAFPASMEGVADIISRKLST